MKIKTLIASTVLGAGLAMFSLSSIPAMAVTCPDGTLREGSDVPSLTECNLDKNADGGTLIKTIKNIINVVVGVLAIVSVAMVIYGGFQYIISSGDSSRVIKANRTILYGVIGLVVAILAYSIVNFALSSVFGSSSASESSSVSGS